MNWNSFREFLLANCSKRYAEDKVRASKKFAFCLLNEDFSAIQTMTECKRNLVMCSMSSLAKFLGVHERSEELIRAYGLKWKRVNAEDLLIARMQKVEQNGDVLEWIKKVSARVQRRLDLEDFRTGFNYLKRFASDIIAKEEKAHKWF